MGSEDKRDPGINPTAKGGPASPVIPGTDGAQASGGPHVGAAEGGVKGVLGMGSSAVGHPSGAMGSDGDSDELPLGDEERAQGVVSERNVSVLGGGPAAAREAGALDAGAGPSGAMGAGGSGSTTDVPGGSGRFASNDARIGGLQKTGGPSRDSDPAAQANVRGAGARDESDRRDG